MRLVLTKATATGYPLQGRREFQGLQISIENRKGSVRRGVDPDGNEWKTKMRYPYGYIRLTEGADGDHLDCFIGPNENATHAYIVRQVDPATGRFDEDKVMLGFNTAKAAKRAFLAHYDSPDFFGSMVKMDMETFKRKALDRDRWGKRVAKAQISITELAQQAPIIAVLMVKAAPPHLRAERKVRRDGVLQRYWTAPPEVDIFGNVVTAPPTQKKPRQPRIERPTPPPQRSLFEAPKSPPAPPPEPAPVITPEQPEKPSLWHDPSQSTPFPVGERGQVYVPGSYFVMPYGGNIYRVEKDPQRDKKTVLVRELTDDNRQERYKLSYWSDSTLHSYELGPDHIRAFMDSQLRRNTHLARTGGSLGSFDYETSEELEPILQQAAQERITPDADGERVWYWAWVESTNGDIVFRTGSSPFEPGDRVLLNTRADMAKWQAAFPNGLTFRKNEDSVMRHLPFEVKSKSEPRTEGGTYVEYKNYRLAMELP